MDFLEVQIPLLVMQTWKTCTLPSEWKASQDSIHKYLPEWKYVLMTDEMNLAFVKEYFPDFLNTYLAFPYNIQRADAIRYLWFYVHGGVYMDLDIKLLRPLDELFYVKKDLYVIKSLYFSGIYTNALMASQPKNLCMLKCVELMSRTLNPHENFSKHFEVINSTGPNMFTRAIELTKLKYREKFMVGELPTNLILNDVYTSKEDLDNPKRYSILLGGSSWIGNDSKIMLTVYHKKKEFAMGLLFFLLVLALIKYQSTRSTF